MDYLEFGYKTLAALPPGTRLARHENMWIKRSEGSKIKLWHKLQSLMPQPILRSTATKDGAAALQGEAARLRAFKAAGFHVATVLAVNDDMLITTHLGDELQKQLDGMKDFGARLVILKQAVAELGKLHKANLAHGRPYVRDMTWDEERVGLLDLEEDPLSVMPLTSAQARDIWIFLCSICRYARVNNDKYTYDPALVGILFSEYRAYASAETLAELKKFVNLLKPLRFARHKLLWQNVGNDVRRAVVATEYLASVL